METLKNRVISAHIQEYYPNARIAHWDEPDSTLTFFAADALEQAEDGWFPLCCYRDSKTGKTIYGGRKRVVHTYTEGETGAGKTSRYAMQSIRALSGTKGKPSFLIVDIHGELAENLYEHLRNRGYTIRILNCDDPSRSDTYNPFTPLIQRCLETGELDTEVLNQIRKIAELMQPVESTKDPIWDQGARSYVNGLILDKFEDLLAGDIPPECLTIYNIIENHYWLRRQFTSINSTLFSIPHYKKKSASALSVQKMISVTNNAEKTRASYYGVVENHFDVFGQPSLYRLSSNSTIDIEEFINEPTAIFIQSGTTRIGDDLISLLMNEIYNTAVRLGRKSPTKLLPRNIHCFLDEFANSNIAEGQEFIRMLTTSRKFGMYWHMLLQCDAQLDRKFDENIGRIIRANCTEIFMGSHDHETMVRFARSCGQQTVEALPSQVAADSPTLTTVDLITPDKLNLTPEGCMYIKSNRQPLLYSFIEAFYKCPEFQRPADISSIYPVNSFDYTTTTFFPDEAPPTLTDNMFQVLRLIHQQEKAHLAYLKAVFPALQLTTMLRNLVRLKLLREDENEEDLYWSAMTARTMRILQKRHAHVPEPVLPQDFQMPLSNKQTTTAFVQTFQEHLIQKEATPYSVLSACSGFSCLSNELRNAIASLVHESGPDENDMHALSLNTLHFSLLEELIYSNDFTTKEEYVEQMQEEYNNARMTELFPHDFTLIFAKALRELKELTIGNILEIKKIIAGSTDE